MQPLVTTDVSKNVIGNQSLKYLFEKNTAAIREDVDDTCISIQVILMMPVSVYQPTSWSSILIPVYKQATADTGGRYIIHLIFGESDNAQTFGTPCFVLGNSRE
jgi:hypothetical protein